MASDHAATPGDGLPSRWRRTSRSPRRWWPRARWPRCSCARRACPASATLEHVEVHCSAPWSAWAW